MSAATTNLIIDQGATWEITFTYKDANGDAIPLTGLNAHTAALQLRKSYDAISTSPSEFLSLSSPSNGIVLPTTPDKVGTIEVIASATQTGALTAGEYVYDLEITRTSSGKVTRLVQGRITVTPQVTKT